MLINLEKAMNTKKIEISYLIPFNDIFFTDFLVLHNILLHITQFIDLIE